MPFEKSPARKRGKPPKNQCTLSVYKNNTAYLRVPAQIAAEIGTPNRVLLLKGTGRDEGKAALIAAADDEGYAFPQTHDANCGRRRLSLSASTFGLPNKPLKTLAVPHQIIDDMIVITLPAAKPALAVA